MRPRDYFYRGGYETMSVLSIFVFLGALHLVWMTIEDYKHSMKIDSRHNYFMYGTVIALFLVQLPPFLIIIGLSLLAAFYRFLLRKYMGGGDVDAITWCVIGFGMFHLVWVIVFLALFAAFHGVYVLIMRRFKVRKLQGLPLLLGAFIITAVMVVMGA